MGTVSKLSDYKISGDKRPRRITFYSAMHQGLKGEPRAVNISVHILNGDVAGIIQSVIESHGIGETHEDGTTFWIPWPCAAVTINDE